MAPAQPESPDVPREVDQPCSKCGARRKVLNGAYYQGLRLEIGLLLSQMTRHTGRSTGYLSMLERGERPFPPEVAAAYERTYKRYRSAVDLS